jgi:hypothetical protein
MEERPDYVPAMWMNRKWLLNRWLWPINRWFAASPRRMIGWFCVYVGVSVTVLVLGVVTGATVWAIFGALSSVVSVWQAAVYVPRARRAMHRERAQQS